MKTTPLYQLHRELGARLTPFAGYDMPLQYTGIKQEHLHTRNHSSLFDVSHMGLARVSGKSAISVLEQLLPCQLSELADGQQRYSLLINKSGGVIDDLMVTRIQDEFFLVLNAGCKDKDLTYLQQYLDENCQLEVLSDHALIAVQGPESSTVLTQYLPRVNELNFMHAGYFPYKHEHCLVSRSGYTGEDGFEIAVPVTVAEHLARELLSHSSVQPAGLGARDTLRLEAGLCLYGHELDENISPVEAGLTWTISKSRLQDNSIFPGRDRLTGEIDNGPTQIRVGLKVDGRIPVRDNSELLNTDGQCIGKVTSGGYSPVLEAPIAMGYVKNSYAKPGTELQAHVRNKVCKIHVVKLPFVAHRYFRNQ